MSKIYLLTGEIQSGKTNLCLELIEMAKAEGILLGGVISPGVFDEGKKIAIDLMDLKSGERRNLAGERGEEDPEISTQRWAFKTDAIAWGNQVLKSAIPCDLLIIDELGPLEFNRGEGWMSAFEVIASEGYRWAIVVVRPSLLEEALDRWDVDRIINLDDSNEDLKGGKDLFESLIGREI